MLFVVVVVVVVVARSLLLLPNDCVATNDPTTPKESPRQPFFFRRDIRGAQLRLIYVAPILANILAACLSQSV